MSQSEAAAHSQPYINPSLPQPSQDSWYTATPGWEAKTPGNILRIRTVSQLAKKFESCSAVYQILYRTTNSKYEASWAVTTLLVPQHVGETSALLSYQMPYNSPTVDAGPSYSLHSTNPLYEGRDKEIAWAMSRGWHMCIPDHESHTASFGLGLTSGHATLDGIRACLSSGFGLHDTARVAVCGYSGGAYASAWAAELQSHYAPELNDRFAGAALGGLPPHLHEAMSQFSGKWYAGLVPSILLGITSEYPSAREYLISQLRTEGEQTKDKFLAAKEMPIEQLFQTFAMQPIFDYFITGAEILNAPPLLELFNGCGTLGNHGLPRAPLYIYKAINDEITPISHTDDLVSRWKSMGVNVVYERNTIGDHLAEAQAGTGRTKEWLSKVLEGKYEHVGCTVRDVTVEGGTTALVAAFTGEDKKV